MLPAAGFSTFENLDQTACDNVINGGLVQADEFGCPAPTWDPSPITNVALPIGGTGTLEYLWIFTTDDPNSPFAQWTPIPGSNSPDYDPGPISVTTYFRRCARRSGCTEFIGESNIITKEAICCDNVTDGGQIGNDQAGCLSPFDPANLVNIVSPSGGSSFLEYQWVVSTTGTPYSPANPDWSSITNATTASFDPGPVSVTTYFVRLSRRHGCTDYVGISNMVTISISDPVSATATASPVSCFGGNDGTIALDLDGGTAPFQYSWDPQLGNVQNPQSLTAGNYSVTVTDVNGCTGSTTVTVDDGIEFTFSIDWTDETCLGANNGTASVNGINGGNPVFSFQWSYPLAGNTQSVFGLPPDNYGVTVTDAQGCTAAGNFAIAAGPMLDVATLATDAFCSGGDEGTATVVSVAGGSGNYSYQWDDSQQQSTATASGLTAGTYNVVVNDDQGCTGIASAIVGDGAQLVLTTFQTDATCGYTDDGTATVEVTGGASPYNYLWNDAAAQTTATAFLLGAGSYSVTVTDANGCTATASETVQAPMDAEIQMGGTDVNCFGASDGTVSVDILNGDPADYFFQWNDSGNSTTPQVAGLPAGSYSVTVSDANGCLVVGSVNIVEPPQLALAVAADSATCGDGIDGTATVFASGGTPFGNGGYQYNWDAPGNPQGQMLAAVLPGTYSVTVDDANGCTAVASIEIGAPEILNILQSSTDVTCSGANDGEVAATVSGGVQPYAYLWDDFSGSVTPGLSDLGPGVYGLTVTDANGCTATSVSTVFEPPALGLTLQKTDVICVDDTDGTAAAVVTGGVSPYNYEWGGGQTTAQLNGLPTGNYEVTVTDANGCEISGAVEIVSTTTLSVSLLAVPANCFDSNDGSVLATVSGGTAPFGYQWNNGATGALNAQLFFGDYAVTVTDADGCSVTAAATVTAPPELTCATQVVSQISTFSGDDGALSVTPGGGAGPFSIEWSNGSTQGTISNLEAGAYTVTVTDANDCTCASAISLVNPSKVGNYVWHDLDQDGVQDAGEPGLEGVTVHLIGATTTGTQINLTTLTGTDGVYHFDGLSAGNYQIKVEPLSLHVFSPANIGNDNFDSDINPGDSLSIVFAVAQGYYDNRWDAGLVELDEKINIGDFVWQDADHDGIQDINEQGLAGVPVKLFQVPGNVLVAATTTNLLGKYLFTDVMPGSYFVEFSLGTLPNGYVFAPQNIGTNDELDSDPDPATGRTAVFQVFPFTVDNLTIDAGVFKECDNATDGGLIGYDEALCGLGADPAEIVNLVFPTGGFGTLEYLWLSSTVPVYNGPGDPNWAPIPNSNTPNYDPGPINQSTYFIRCARRQGCVDYPAESNIVAKTVTTNPLTQIIQQPGTLCVNETGNFAAAIAGGGATYFWEFGAAAVPQTANTRVVNGVYWTAPGVQTVTLTVTRFGCSFSVTTNIQVNTCGSPLMVIDDLTATLEGETVELEWDVDGDASSTIFFVQRSENGVDFENLMAVAGELGAENSTYRYIDTQPRLGENIYRIKYRQSSDGIVEGFSSNASIVYRPEGMATAAVYPNPTFGRLTLELFEPSASPVEIQVWSAFGKVLEVGEMAPFTEKMELDLSRYSQGVYWVRVKLKGIREQVFKVVKVD